MTILLVTRSADAHCTPRVHDILKARGLDVARFDTDLFPGPARLVTAETGPARGRLILPDRAVDLEAITAVWHRRMSLGGALPATMDPAMRHAAIVESRALLDEVFEHLPAFALDPIAAHRSAAGKQRQLAVAAEVGLRVPRTRFTNDPDAVRALVEACPGGVVTKMMHRFDLPTDGGSATLYTSVLDDDDIAALDDGLELCPMTFQEHIPKARELRVVAVGPRLWTGAIESPKHAGAEVDWRREGAELIDAWAPVELPRVVGERIRRLMGQLGLIYGAIDLIVTPEGEHVFLEVNPGGEYFWLEDHCGFEISAAIADRLQRGVG